MLLSRRAMLSGALSFCAAAPASAGAKLRSVKVTEGARVPLIRPDWPIPGEPHQLFYVQRSTNKNTVVYTGRFDRNGNLDRNTPAQAYWRRYASGGERMALRSFERRIAYGMRIHSRPEPGEWNINAMAAPQFPMLLRNRGGFQADVFTRIGGRTARPVYGFIEVDESGLLPRVTGLSMHGTDVSTGRAISEYFSVSGGRFRQ